MSAAVTEVPAYITARRTDGGSASGARESTEEKTKSVVKALLLMDVFEASPEPLGLTTIAQRAGLPKSTAHRLLSYLEAAGFVERDAGKYCVGRKVQTLGSYARSTDLDLLRHNALPFLSGLFHRSELSVCLGALSGSEVKLEVKIQSHNGFRAPRRSGERITSTSTSLGKAILAFSPAPVVDRFLTDGLHRMTRYSLVDPEAFRNDLREIRQRGFAIDRQESRLGIVSVAAPVIVQGAVQAAVSVTGPSNRFDAGRLIADVTRTARDIAAVHAANSSHDLADDADIA